jgi:hypothetical protein
MMSLTRRIVLSSAAGYGAGLVMDKVTTGYLDSQTESSRAREKQVQPEPATTVLVKKIAGSMNRRVEPDQAQQLGAAFHTGMAVSGAYVAGALLARGWRSIPAGMAAGLFIWAFVDEGLNYALGLTAPATDFPVESHVRGLVGHLAYGGALGGFLAIARRLWRG